MWGLWFFPLVTLLFWVGLAMAVLWYLVRALTGKRPETPVAVGVIAAAPFGCAALPFLAFGVLATISPLLMKSDTQLYEEVFGQQPALGENRLLFDDFGGGTDREIFLRADATNADREKMLAAVPLRASEYSLDDFAALGDRHGGFSWWISTDPQRPEDRCKSGRILEAHGFRGWREFRVAECLDGRTESPDDQNTHDVFIAAFGRP